MRSQAALLRRQARSALSVTTATRRARSIYAPITTAAPVAARQPRKPRVAEGRPLTVPVVGMSDTAQAGPSSSTGIVEERDVVDTEASPPRPPPDAPDEPAPEDAEKPKTRRARTVKEPSSTTSTLPVGLDVLWQPASDGSAADVDALPPADVFGEALTSVRVALHPQTQNRATYASAGDAPVEPAIALYCPIEGGDYVLDEAVRELARQTGADVLVLDAVQLAAGEWGTFGKGMLLIMKRP
jgi:hypothetical protein